tara:strand:- start:1937 stop:2377 length:441 start_codon:yes stop_codon:yes gene_type:complete
MNLIKDYNFKKIVSLFWQQDGSPYYKAKGVAVGVFSGCFPFFGLQTLIGIFFAQIIKGNLFLAALGTWISNPFTYIPLYILNYKIGNFILRGKSDLTLDLTLIKDNFFGQGWFITSRLILGSSIVGLFLGILFGSMTYYLFRFYKK